MQVISLWACSWNPGHTVSQFPPSTPSPPLLLLHSSCVPVQKYLGPPSSLLDRPIYTYIYIYIQCLYKTCSHMQQVVSLSLSMLVICCTCVATIFLGPRFIFFAYLKYWCKCIIHWLVCVRRVRFFSPSFFVKMFRYSTLVLIMSFILYTVLYTVYSPGRSVKQSLADFIFYYDIMIFTLFCLKKPFLCVHIQSATYM